MDQAPFVDDVGPRLLCVRRIGVSTTLFAHLRAGRYILGSHPKGMLSSKRGVMPNALIAQPPRRTLHARNFHLSRCASGRSTELNPDCARSNELERNNCPPTCKSVRTDSRSVPNSRHRVRHTLLVD